MRFFHHLLGFAAAGAACAVSIPAVAQDARMVPMAAPAEPDAIALNTGGVTGSPAPEAWFSQYGVAMTRNVSSATLTPFLPDPAKATGAAVIVAPGGAYLSLSMDAEGFAVAGWLADHGIAAFVLKYRLNPTPDDEPAFMGVVEQRMGGVARGGAVADISEPRAAIDALQAIKLVREGAAHYRIDPAKVGMIGFSAGAITALQAVLTGKEAARPAFFGYIYGPMVTVPVPANAPPMFAALALDDPLFGRQGFGIVESWHKAGVPVELHAYERGDHGFGTGRKGTTTTLMLDEFRLWLASRGLLKGPGQ